MADPELEAVEEALNVLALAESDMALQKVITRLLPAVLEALSTKSKAARAKCIETLQHINVRLRASPSVKLPFYDVLRVATKPDAAVFTVNLAVQGGYLTRCFDRLSTAEKAQALPALVTAAVTVTSPVNRAVVNFLSIRALSARSAQTPVSGSPDLFDALNECSQAAIFALFDYILQSLRQKLTVTLPDSALVSSVRLASEYAGTKNPERAARIFPILLVAAGTTSRSSLVAAAEDALKKIQSADVLAAADPSIVQTLFNLYNDTLAEIPVRVVILSKGLLNITLCASCFPEVLDVIRYSLQTPGVPPRLQALGMQFFSFVLANADRTVLIHNADPLNDVLVQLASDCTNGSPSFPDAVRGYGFTGLGELVLRVPSLFGTRNITADFFFLAAQAPLLPAPARTCATQALIAIMRVLKFDPQSATELRSSVIATLRRTLANRAEHAAPARSAAVQWANECFLFSDCEARLLNMLAAADLKQDVRQYALAGLAPKRWRFKDGSRSSDDITEENKRRLTLRDVVDVYSTYVKENGSPHPQTTEAFLKFAFYILRYSVVSGGKLELIHVSKVDNFFNDHIEELDPFLQVVNIAEGILTTWNDGIKPSLENIAISIIAFSSRVESLKHGCVLKFANRIDDLVQLATRKSATGNVPVVRAVAKIIATVTDPLPLDDLNKLVQKLSKDLEPDPSGLPSGRKGEDLRVASIFCVTQIIDRYRQRHGVGLNYSETSPLSHACEHISRRILLPVESTEIVRIAACIGLGDIGTSGPLPVSPACRTNFIAALSGILKSHSTNSKLVLAAADTIGRVCIGEPRFSMRQVAGETLLTLCKERNEDDVHFVAAESLTRAVSGFDAPPPAILEEANETASDDVVSSESEILQGVLLMRTNPFKVSEPIEDESSGKTNYGLKAAIEGAIHLASDERPGARAGGCVCLFTLLRLLGRKVDGTSIDSMLSFCTSGDEKRFNRQQDILLSQLKNIQHSFTVLLGDRSDFVQQLASCGLALAYEMCPPAEQHDLVTTLVRSLTSSKGKSAATVPGDQGTMLELEGVDTQSGSGGGSKSATYKELCSLAQDMGQPDLVYKFMDLAGHAALWNNRKGVALAGSALLGSDLAAEQLKPHLKTLLPRLYVYCYDPTESVRLAMGSVLGAIIKAAGLGSVYEAVTIHFDIVVEHCLRSMTSRQWRSREAGCGGLRDVLSSRTWEQVKEHLQDFWYHTLRALDDIKETVRKAAGGAGRALAQLSVHLCDPGQVGVDNARAASDIVIPAVMSGIMHQDTEIRALASSTMTKLIRHGGEALHASVASLVGMLLEAASELEPQMLNYAQFHIENPEQLEDVRVSAASTSASPLVDSLERLSALVNESNAEDTVRTMIRVAKVGVGIPTRAATARFFSTMLRTRATVLEPYAAKLMWSAVSAATSETNGMLRDAWCSAAGKAVSLCKEESAGKFIDRIVQLGGSEDSRERLLASYLAAALWKHSAEAARKYASAVLPLAYMGAYEGDDTPGGAAKCWTEVWEEGAPSTQAGLRHYAKEITEICEKRLTTSAQYGVKRSAAAALGALAKASNESVDVKYIRKAGTALVHAVPGHIWDGKIVVIESIGTIGASYPKAEVWADVGGVRGVVETLLGEAKRGKREYQLTAIDAATNVLKGCPGLDVFGIVDEALRGFWSSNDGEVEGGAEVSRMVWETGSDASAVDARNRARKSKKLLCISSLKCLEAASRGNEQYMRRMVEVAESVLQWDWEVRLGAIESVKECALHCEKGILYDTSTSKTGTNVLQRIVDIARVGVLDAKYASLRKAGLDTLEVLMRQVGTAKTFELVDGEISEAISKAAKDDSDSAVQKVAKKILAQKE